MKTNEMLTLNPLLNGDFDKYIWISNLSTEHKAAQCLFDYLLKKNIYVKGFVTNIESLVALKMYNKIIYDVNTLDKIHSVVLYDPYFGSSDINIFCKSYAARIVNPDMAGEKCVVFGSGVTAKNAQKILMDNKIQVKFLVPEEINTLSDDTIIVEAFEKGERDYHHGILEKYDKRFHYSMEYDEIAKEIACEDCGIPKKLFSLSAFWMFNHFVGKKIYIYGTGCVEKEFVKYLDLLDFSFAGYLIDETDLGKEDDNKYPVKFVEEILYEEDWYIWTYDQKRAIRLNTLGIKYFKDYYVKNYRFDVTINQKTALDLNLGNTYLTESKYPGFVIYGNNKENDFKIVALGGSTTDGTMYPFKSWAQLLYEELQIKNVTIYNGGVCSYTSGQELIKLLRDALQLEPDMVIVYDGYNDLAFNVSVEYPFATIYLEDVFEYARMNGENDEISTMRNDLTVCRGIASRRSYFENWKSNIRTMYAVASERNIRFFSFCQPVLSSKKGHTVREKNILLSMLNSKIELFHKESFRNYMARMSDRPKYMYDLSHIFDGSDSVYMDVCHVWENGNQIIAKEIKKIIMPEIFSKIQQKN